MFNISYVFGVFLIRIHSIHLKLQPQTLTKYCSTKTLMHFFSAEMYELKIHIFFSFFIQNSNVLMYDFIYLCGSCGC